MTHIIRARNVNWAFQEGFWWLKTSGVEENSRNGPVIVSPGPVITEYTRPWERVLFNPKRDANHVFHLMESLWMLAGHNEVEWLTQFSSNIATYAEDDGTIHGAYGYRWRNHFGIDQIQAVIDKLFHDPASRHGVIQMWDPEADIYGSWRDRPCNTEIFVDCRVRPNTDLHQLNMTVVNRSNDILWGAYGANVVHMSVLQEVLAAALDIHMGVYRQFSNNFHAYIGNEQAAGFLKSPPDCHDEYSAGVGICPLVHPGEDYEALLEDAKYLTSGSTVAMRTIFCREVAKPMCDAYLGRKAGTLSWERDLRSMRMCDWKIGFQQWLSRREGKTGGTV